MVEVVYLLCALTSIVCAAMLYRGYRSHRTTLLFWSSLCFIGLALNNILTFLDIVIVPTAIDLAPWRSGIALSSMVLLIYGLVWESK